MFAKLEAQCRKVYSNFAQYFRKTCIKFFSRFLNFLKFSYTSVVPKLVLILSGQTCNAIYQNSDEARVFCSVLPFQQTPTNTCMSNRSRVTAGFVKTVVYVIDKIVIITAIDGYLEGYFETLFLVHTSIHY